MKIRDTSIGAVVVALTGVLIGAPAIASADPDQALLDLINQQRAQSQLPCNPLNLPQNPQLQAAADRAAKDLATNGFGKFPPHTGSDGSTSQQRADDAGYNGFVAENAAQNASLQGVVTGWMNSEGHKTTMLGCMWLEAGTATARTPDGLIDAVALFGWPKSAGPPCSKTAQWCPPGTRRMP